MFSIGPIRLPTGLELDKVRGDAHDGAVSWERSAAPTSEFLLKYLFYSTNGNTVQSSLGRTGTKLPVRRHMNGHSCATLIAMRALHVLIISYHLRIMINMNYIAHVST